MNMRTGGFGGADRWADVTINAYYYGKPPEVMDVPGDEDPLDIDAPAPRACSAKPSPRSGDAPTDADPMNNPMLLQLLQIIFLLGLLKKDDQVPEAGDKDMGGGGGGGGGGSPERSNAPWRGGDEPRIGGDDGEDGGTGPAARARKGSGASPGKRKADEYAGEKTDESPDKKARPKTDETVDEKNSEKTGGKSDAGKTGKTSKAGGPGTMPEPTGTVTVNETIVVKAGQVFDGGGKLYKAGKALGDGGQSEDQKPVFVIEPGGVLKNLQYEGADGIHTMGDATIKDVWARDVGEDAMTMKKPGNVTWSGGGAFNANDKIFQLNAGGSFTLENFTADGFGKAVRTNGGHQIDTDIVIRNSEFKNGKEAIVRTDSTSATISLEGVTFSNVPNDVLAPDATEVSGAVKRGKK
ncbi:pectate lyase [Pseudoduganella namucuonensis]|uniref:pectate lyase n=1 Tax=Pseudoduganella namucuonensis TaxID=1035707 RepID=A0A1I7LW60_9BURK|nr:pectate lyase [Pseudoduganella namucuonensis]SFV13810.1 Pectate lyase [Pseudoduganella namucuonensis]